MLLSLSVRERVVPFPVKGLDVSSGWFFHPIASH